MIRLEKKIKLPPDLFSRNTLFSLLIELFLQAEKNPEQQFSILDIGGYEGRLSWFMPKNISVTVLDRKPAQAGTKTNYIQGDALKTPFPAASFDLVISSDLLEHLPAARRPDLLNEMLRVSKRFVILAAPFESVFNRKAEDLVNTQFIELTGHPHPFLAEHIANGLPDPEDIENAFLDRGLKFARIGEGNINNWLIQQLNIGLMSGRFGKAEATTSGILTSFFNENLTSLGNFRSPCYRTVYCADQQNLINAVTVQRAVEEINNLHTGTYFNLLKKLFDESQSLLLAQDKVVEQEKSKRLDLSQKLESWQTEMEQLQESQHNREQSYQLINRELELTRNHADNLTNMLEESAKKHEEQHRSIITLRADLDTLSTENARLELQNHDLREETASLQENLVNSEARKSQSDFDLGQLQQKHSQLLAQKNSLENSLAEYKTALEGVLNSRSWRLVRWYGRVKDRFYRWPLQKVRKVIYILKNEGLKSFISKVLHKFFPSKPPLDDPYAQFLKKYSPSEQDFKKMAEESVHFNYQPLISIVVPVYNTDEIWLQKMADSVFNQVYQNWELCLADDGSTKPFVKKFLQKLAKKDSRIKVSYRPKNGGIVAASNSALKLAKGAYVALLDSDDELSRDALFEVVKALQEEKYDLVYSDEDKLELDGRRSDPYFKSDFNPELLFSNNYICHFSVMRRKVVEDIGSFREGTDGAQDYDLMLRLTDKKRLIKHIPKVLYHWRKIPGSTAATTDAKPYVFNNAKKALSDALHRRGIAGDVSDGLWKGSYRVKRKIIGQPKIAIVICFKDVLEVLKVAVDSVLAKTTYPNYQIILINNRSEKPETLEYLRSLDGHPKIILDAFNFPFNYSGIYNYAAEKHDFDYLVQLNSDTEVISPDWLESLLEHAQRPEVAAVGAKLFYPNGHIQHAGVLLGIGGVANHAFAKVPGDTHGYFGMINSTRNYSAVTFACVMMKKSTFLEIRMDDQKQAISFSDTDFCLRAVEKGYQVIYTPYAKLYHHECYSRGFVVNFEEEKHFRERHADFLAKGDPFYNPNLSRDRFDFSLKI